MTRAEDPNLQPLLEILEDDSASQTERTDAFLTLANRLSGEEGKEFTAVVGQQFPRVCKLFKTHIVSENSDLSNAALQALGFCVFNSKIASGLSVTEIHELLTTLISIATKSPDKNTCTRALWVIAKQCFPSEEVGKLVPQILSTLETVLNRGDVQSMVIEYEALNTVIRLLEQTPTQMGEEAARWAKLVIPLVVHSAPRVRLRGATALEIGMPLLLQKQQDVAAITEPLMSTKIISELQRLFSSKNETYVLKLWPLFVKLLGKTLHRSGSFINSLLQLEELGFRSGSPLIKKIAFIAWKSLIDNFALNPDILSSTKRLKLLMQPLCSIHVRTEALALTKLEVWWYLLMRLGPQLSANFEQVCAPLIQNTLSVDSSSAATPIPAARGSANQSLNQTGLKAGPFPYGSPATPKMNLNSSSLSSPALPSVQLLGLEMLVHFLLGPEVVPFAKKNNLVLGLEPLLHPLISSSSFFCKHASTLLNAVQDGFIAVGKDASDAIVQLIWKDMISLVKATIEAGNKRDRQGSDVFPLLLQALKNIVTADILPAQKALTLIESTIKGLPQKALGSPAYQMANMDLLHGTPALFIIQLLFHSCVLEQCAVEERFFICLETLVSCVLSGPTSPLAFSESVVGVIGMQAKLLENKEHVWRMWSIVVNPLTEKISQTNEVNQGDALEHNFSAMHAALTLPVSHLYPVQGFPQPSMKSLLRTWSELYKAFARCAALVATTEENVCCEELCAKILAGLGEEILTNFSTLDCIVQSLLVVVECINFSPYSSKYPPKTKAPQTPTDWAKRKREPLGNLSSFLRLLVKMIDSFHALASKEPAPEMPASSLVSVGNNLIGILTSTISRIALASVIRKLFEFLMKPLATFYEKTSKSSDVPKVYSSFGSKLEKLLGEILLCLQSRYSGVHESDLLEDISPLLCVVFLHKNKQIRNQTAQFWNATFAKTTGLLYPAELKPVLSKVKQKTPILLPGFETVEVAEGSNGPFSDPNENSQLDTKISGMEVKSTGKRNSMLAQAEEHKDGGTPIRSKQPKLKLDFSSPKNKPAERFLDEEKTMDFVFIPPETKERVLTEHQKDVLRTKRVDIPTMYNNLDASQDTTMFTKYSQSQEDSVEKPVEITKDTETEKQPNDGENLYEEDKMDTEAAGTNKDTECLPEEKLLDESIHKEENMSIGGNTSTGSNSSVSSDVVSDTPPPPASRRLSFITLEKFDSSGNKQFSPSSDKFPVSNIVTVPGVKKSSTGAQAKNVGKRKMEEKNGAKIARTDSFGSGQKSDMIEVDCPSQDELLASGGQVEDSMNISTCEEPKSSEEQMHLEDAECIPDTQQEESNVIPLEGVVKESKRVNETQADIESKENKPPGEGILDLKNNSDLLIQNTAVNQMSLRRSRRRLDVSESGIDDKQKLDHLKKDGSLGEQMYVQNALHIKGDLQQNKPILEKVDGLLRGGQNENDRVDNSDAGGFGKEVLNDRIKKEVLTDLPEKVLGDLSKNNASEPGKKVVSCDLAKKKILSDLGEKKDLSKLCENGAFLQEDISKSIEGSLNDGRKSETCDSQDFSSEKGIKEKTTVRSRYQTRRASLILLPGTENSESDSSETKEDIITTKKRSRGRPKGISPLDPKNDEQSHKQDPSATPIEGDKGPLPPMTNEVESSSEKDTKTTELCNTYELKDQSKTNCTYVNEPAGFIDSNKMVIEQSASEVEPKSQVLKSIGADLSEPDFETVHSNKTHDIVQRASEDLRKTESLITEPAIGDFSAASSDVIFCSENSVIPLECQHKRSKRLRKSKGCDCCSGQLEEKPLMDLKSSEKQDLKPVDHNIKSLSASVSAVEASSIEGELEDSVFAGPSAESTLLLSSKKPHFFKESVDQASSVSSEDEMTVVPRITSSEDSEEAALRCATHTAIASVAELKELDKICKPCPPTENVSKEAQEKHIVTLGTECDKSIALVQEEKVTTDALAEEILGEALPTNTASLISECDHNEMVIDNSQTVSSCLATSEVQSSLTVKVQSDSAVVGQLACEEQAMDIASSEGQFEEKAPLQQTGVGTASFREQAFGSSVISGEQTMLARVTSGEETVVGTAPSGEQTGVPNITSREQSALDLPSSDEHSMVCVDATNKQSTTDCTISGGQAVGDIDIVGSPPKLKGLECATLVSINGSPSEVQARCIWSPSASPSTSILKKGIKRPQEDESPSPLNKMRRVSFADPIYKEEMADDIDRRSPVVRCLSSTASSPTARALKISSNVQCKLITTPTKGFISPGSRSLGPKSSKKCLITEMAKESLPSPKESVYPALINCTTPVDVILPQITSNMWARGLGQLIRAKNIKTIGDLSTLTVSELKTLPIRSPKISTVKKALRVFHEQQMKTRGFDEFVALEEADKQMFDDKTSPPEDDPLAPDLLESASLLNDRTPSTDLMAQIDALALQLTPEELSHHSGSLLFEMQEKLSGLTNCVMRHLQTRWTSPPHEGST
ncbi:telomere-associated protein RIF1 isoform X2 [Lissotriton helveticus]